ncbi:THO complex subunit 1-like isoform X2 [Stegodyphus dumicola]|uniref:THO complex subunit 1-like isoform X2 n=1 Tax=Stegodyphus dumicola TaxID=202533 RepID=UPI0015A947B2|nr:THO complex subunit 1-like isoform X2 [Stegodyphus dumicola]
MGTVLDLKSKLSLLFKDVVERNSFDDFIANSRQLLKSQNENDLKNIIELTVREVLLELIMQKTDIIHLERVFQFSIDAALRDIAPGNLPVLVLGDMFEASTVVECEKIFAFVESRVETFKKDIFFKTCKNHLLRSCNDLLRRLSRSQNTVFCGRILLFLAHIFPLSERSGLNIISEFNLENTTVYTTNDEMFSDLNSEKGDIPEEGEIPSNSQSHINVDISLYRKFWSLQDFFRNPNTCYNKIQWRQFTNFTSDILVAFGSFKSDGSSSSKWKDAKLSSPNGACFYFAKYLTSPKLLELELSDSHFRRYVLVQFLILFQYLTSPVKFKQESFVLSDEQQTWVKDTTKKVYKLLEETPPDGLAFAEHIEKILQREEYWNAWKNEGCPDFKQVSEKIDLDKRPLKRPWECQQVSKFKPNPELAKLLSNTPNNWEACRSAKRNFVPSLETFFGVASSKADATSNLKRDFEDSKYTWKALRLLCMKSPHIFTASTSTSKSVSEYLESVVQKISKEKCLQQDIVTVEAAVAEDSIEDGNDEFLQEEDSKEESKNSKEEEKAKKENVLNKVLIETISGKLQDQWQVLALNLGFQEDEIEYFEQDFPGKKLQTQQMLTVWMERDGSLVEFTKVLQSCGMLNNVLPHLPAQE